MRTAYFWCRNTLFRFAVNHKPLLQIFGEIGELVQPRYKRGIDKYRDSNLSFCMRSTCLVVRVHLSPPLNPCREGRKELLSCRE